MISYFRYRRELLRISRYERKVEAQKPLDTEESRQSGQMMYYFQESEGIWEWKRLALTRYFRDQAEALVIPMPPQDDPEMYDRVEWDKDPDEPRYLTDKGVREVRAAIREEQKHRREVRAFWLTWVTGLGGVLIGIVSVWPK